MTIRALSVLAVLGLSATPAGAATRPQFDASLIARPHATPKAGWGGPAAVVMATEPARGVPSLLWARDPGQPARTAMSAVEAARADLLKHRERYGVPAEVIAGARVLFVHDTGRGGIVVGFRQQVGEHEVVHGDVKVLLDRQHRLLAIAGSPHPGAVAKTARKFAPAFARSQEAAVTLALGDLYGQEFSPSALRASIRAPRAGSQYFDLAPLPGPVREELAFAEPARVKQVYFPLAGELVPAYSVELQVRRSKASDLDVFHYVVAAEAGSGAVLLRADLTAYDAYAYRVWADPDGEHRPADGPLQDFTPHPSGLPDIGPAGPVKPTVVTIEGLNHNPDGLADPWLPPGSVETIGNHVDAYVDHSDPDGLNTENGEFRAGVTAPGMFEHDYNVSAEPLSSDEQSQAAVVQLFYTINWLHDWWYDSGFVEATGVAQFDNFGRGGIEGDRLRAEGQDGALTGKQNNANMSTPADGASPRMQMYLWSPRINVGSLTVTPGDVEYEVKKAQFGPLKFDVNAPLVLLEDGEGVDPHDGCEAPTNDLSGAIVLIHRGNCTFESKAVMAEAAGAVGVLISNHMNDGLPPLGVDNDTEDPTIPVLGLTLADGMAIEAMLAPESTAHITGTTDVARDGTIDNMIIAHEYGHYLHHRLEDCGTPQCGAMSEGWGDYTALMMMLREGDPLDGVYAAATYGGFDPYGYYGLRRVPYSVRMDRNALTFRHIADGEALPDSHPIQPGGPNSEVHNAGEVWATMVWEAYIALHAAHQGSKSFNEIHRLMTDYLVTGMLMTPHDATFTGQRDAILLAAAASSEADFLTLAEAFARRGAGSCAISPPADSLTFVGVKEDFALQANGRLAGFTFDDSVESCDGDGILDGGERGKIKIDIANGGSEPLPAGSLVEVLSPTDALVFPSGSSAELEAMGVLEATSVEFEVGLAPGQAADEHVTVVVRLTTPAGCTGEKELSLPVALHADIALEASATDDVETPASAEVWTRSGPGSGIVWGRMAIGGGHAWHGEDLGTVTDASLVSPPLKVSASADFVLEFDHAFQFEFSDDTYWDGAVIEFSSDGGMSWQDVATLVSVPYGGTIMSGPNPLNGKPAFVDKNPSYPQADHLSLDFGDKLAGQTVMLRFRIGTDGAAGGAGWTIDNIAFGGITHTPFPKWVPDAATCTADPTSSTGDSETGPTSGAGTSGATSEASSTGEESATGTGGVATEDGCGCRSAGSGAPGLLALGLLGLRRRRRG